MFWTEREGGGAHAPRLALSKNRGKKKGEKHGFEVAHQETQKRVRGGDNQRPSSV